MVDMMLNRERYLARYIRPTRSGDRYLYPDVPVPQCWTVNPAVAEDCHSGSSRVLQYHKG